MYEPIVKLPENVALDIIGDVHGEIDALDNLLLNLGYSSEYAPENRLIVFVGDILDRGPNSYQVFKRVKALVEQGIAVCLLGNHEGNILRGEQKDGSGWFFGVTEGNEEKYVPCYFPTKLEKSEILEFIKTLPIAAYRSDLRIVHACWDEQAISSIEAAGSSFNDFLELYDWFLAKNVMNDEDQKLYEAEKAQWGAKLKDPTTKVPFLPYIAKNYLAKQMSNPVRVLNSGSECHLDEGEEPFYVGGEWRMIKRHDWWASYRGKIPVVIGHYWREPPIEVLPSGKSFLKVKPDPKFSASSNIAWFGLNNNVFCVDFSVGKQFMNRQNDMPLGHNAKLAALRWPEKMVTFDCGITVKTEN